MVIDNLIHSIPRLTIMEELVNHRSLPLKELRENTNLTAGNLHNHCTVLLEAGLIEIFNVSQNEKLVKFVGITHQGATEFEIYLNTMRQYLNKMAFKLKGTYEQIKYNLPPSIFTEFKDPEGNIVGFGEFDS